MISMEDCIAMCGLTEAEVLALAEHEHIPEIVAASLAADLLRRSDGAVQIRDMIRDDFRDAFKRGDMDHARELFAILRHYLATHPGLEPDEGSTPGASLRQPQ
jgi:hypothetical protein